jgi:hypothetical protein
MSRTRKATPAPSFIGTVLLTAGLLAGALAPVSADVFGCSPTSDPMIADCSPRTTTFPIEEDRQQSVSGRAMALTVSADGRRLYTGTFAGVWHSGDGGVTWDQLTRPQPPDGEDLVPGALRVPNVFDVVVSPINADVVLAATAFDTRVRPQNGIYRSQDRGETWSLVHQFICPGAPGVGQIVFAPDTADLAYAAGGCAVAISRDGGRTWVNSPIPDQGKAWHVAVAPQESFPDRGVLRRVYAAGDDHIWYSENGGNTWSQDTAAIIATMGSFFAPEQGNFVKYGVVGGFPGGCCGENSSQVLAIEPGHPERLYVAVTNISNGPAYYFTCYALAADGPCVDPEKTPGSFIIRIPDGENCEQRVRCGGAAVWLGDYSQFFRQGQSGSWRRLASPPAYQGVSTPSGRVYIVAKQTASGYLLFLSDSSHVHVSQGRPEQSAAWHRLDGRDASESKRENDLSNQLFLHVDPHAIAISQDFDLTLTRPTGVSFPYDQNSVREAFLGGTLWMANDGGVYHSTDGGATWQWGSGLATLQLQGPFAGVAVAGNAPALYFGVPDNGNFFSLNRGATWQDPITDCGDCGPWFADPAQPHRVLEFPLGPSLVLHTDPLENRYPNPGPGAMEGRDYRPVPLPTTFAANPYIGYRPIILTPQSEAPLRDGDYILIRATPSGTRVVLRTTKISSITSPTDWDTTATADGPTIKAFQQGPPLPAPVDVVQASGGHRFPVFYAGDPSAFGRLWKWTEGLSAWQPIVPAPDGSATVARRFFVDPYDPNLLYIIDTNAIKRSDNGGLTWRVEPNLDRAVTEDGTFSYTVNLTGLPTNPGAGAVIQDMIFDRLERKMRFAVGNAGVFFTLDGEHWQRLLSTQALPGHPVAAYFDRISDPFNRALYVAMNGRGLLQLLPIRVENADLEPIPPPNFCVVVNNRLQVVVRVGNVGSVFAPASITKVDFFPYGSVEVPTPGIPPGQFVDLDSIAPPSGCFDPDCSFRITVDTGDGVDEGPSGEGNNSANGQCVG